MAAECRGLRLRSLAVALLLPLAVVAVQLEGVEFDPQQVKQAATEIQTQQDISGNDKIPNSVNEQQSVPISVAKQQHNFPTHTCPGRTTGQKHVHELYEGNLDKAELGGQIPSLSSFCEGEECQTGDPESLIKEKVKYYQEQTASEKQEGQFSDQASQEMEDLQFSGNIIQRGMQGLEDMFGHVEKSSVQVFEKLGGVMDKVGLSREQVMKQLDTVMDRVSESKVRVIRSLDSLMDQVSASKTKMMEEIDHVIDKVAHSKVIEEIRALPGEIRESFVLSVRNRSYVAAGVMVAITTAVLVAGAVYFAWCHHDAWSYHRVSPDFHSDRQELGSPNSHEDSGAVVKDSADNQSSKHVSNGHTALGDGDHVVAEDKSPASDGQMISGPPDVDDSISNGQVNHVTLQKISKRDSGIPQQLLLIPICSDNMPEAQVKAGGFYPVQFEDIQNIDSPGMCQQVGASCRHEHQDNLLQPDGLLSDSLSQLSPSESNSHTLPPEENKLCVFESRRGDLSSCTETQKEVIFPAVQKHKKR